MALLSHGFLCTPDPSTWLYAGSTVDRPSITDPTNHRSQQQRQHGRHGRRRKSFHNAAQGRGEVKEREREQDREHESMVYCVTPSSNHSYQQKINEK